MATTIPQQDINTSQNKIIPIIEKSENKRPLPPQHGSMMTPPMSPVNTLPGTARSSLKITAGQTGLPWLSRDAEGSYPAQHLPDEMSPIHTDTDNSNDSIQATSPPPKFMARPRTSSIIRFPTRKRTMQKHIYTMKDGLDPIKVLCHRLTSWQVSVKYLLSMFHNIKKVESNIGKGYRKIDSKLAIPTRIKDQFQSSDGVYGAWSAFRQYTRENSLIHQDFVDFIENEIVPCLKIMVNDIRTQMQSLKKNKNLRTATLWDCRKKADQVITRLNSDIYNTISIQEKTKGPYVICKNDPLLTKYFVIHTIRELYKQENRLHKEFLETQNKYRHFEQENIINVYKQLFQTFEEYRVQHRLERLDGVNKATTILNAIENDSEWQHFVHQHGSDLVKQTAAFKDEQTLDYPNSSHPLIQSLMMGNLQRLQGKKWIESFYILSPVGLLYRFKSEKNLLESPFKPELTMFIPQCTILINPAKRVLELKGKVLGRLFSGKKFFELSASDPNELERWIQAMDPIAIQQHGAITRNPIPTDQPSFDNVSMHSKVQADEENNVNQPGIANLGQVNAAISGATADENGATHKMQPIVIQGEDQHNTAEKKKNKLNGNDDGDDDEVKIQTVEYSTHTPNATPTDLITPYTATTTNDNDYNKATVMNADNDINTKNKAATSPVDLNNCRRGIGPTREGSDVFWDPQ